MCGHGFRRGSVVVALMDLVREVFREAEAHRSTVEAHRNTVETQGKPILRCYHTVTACWVTLGFAPPCALWRGRRGEGSFPRRGSFPQEGGFPVRHVSRRGFWCQSHRS